MSPQNANRTAASPAPLSPPSQQQPGCITLRATPTPSPRQALVGKHIRIRGVPPPGGSHTPAAALAARPQRYESRRTSSQSYTRPPGASPPPPPRPSGEQTRRTRHPQSTCHRASRRHTSTAAQRMRGPSAAPSTETGGCSPGQSDESQQRKRSTTAACREGRRLRAPHTPGRHPHRPQAPPAPPRSPHPRPEPTSPTYGWHA